MSPETIIEAVCAVCGVGRDDLLGPSRLRRHSRPRQLAVQLMSEHQCIDENSFSALFKRHPKGLHRIATEGGALVKHVDYVRTWRDEVLGRLRKLAA